MSSSDSGSGVFDDRRSRVIHLDGGQLRDRDANCGTMIALPDPLATLSVPFDALFLAHYRAIRELGRSAEGPGIAVVAVHVPTCKLAGRAWVAARRDRVASAIIGRHSEVDLLLDAPLLSLRHLALVVPPPARLEAHAVTYEVLDLRTQQAFRDERGRHLEGLAAEGPAFASCGPFALFFLQTGCLDDWPELATDAWAALPDRVLADARVAEPDRWRRGGYAGGGGRRGRMRESTSVTAIPPLLSAGEPLVREGEQPIGALRITSEHGARRIPVGAHAASAGILLGRYSRCDGSDVLAHESISRAHLLVKRVGEQLVAVDTASTEGTFVDGREHAVRTVALDRGEVAVIGKERAFVRWEAAEDAT